MKHIAYIGNFGPTHSTENHMARAFTARGHVVYPFQEDDPVSWSTLSRYATHGEWSSPRPTPDFVLRTRTWEPVDAARVTAELQAAGVLTVGLHLDRWWGLPREREVAEQSFFRCDLVMTADGGHDDEWAAAGVNHLWVPPAVSARECRRSPSANNEFADLADKVVFVGSWQGYHPEWPWRLELIEWLQSTYGERFRAFPAAGRPAIRGQALVDLYAADAVFVGDSCLAGGATRYWSDRIPETLGRGGFLIHPWVDGLDSHFGPEHLATFPLGDLDALGEVIDRYLTRPDQRRRISEAGKAHVLARHTYERRVDTILDAVDALPGRHR